RRHGQPGLLGHGADLLDGFELALMPVAVLVHGPRGAEGEAGAVLGLTRTIVLAGQQAPSDRVVGNDPDAIFDTEGQEIPFDLAKQEVVAGLYRIETDKTPSFAPPERPGHPVGEPVRATDIPCL